MGFHLHEFFMEIIDGHTNATENGKWGNTSHDASIGRLLREMDAAKIDKSLLMPIRTFANNQFVGTTVKKYAGRFIGFGNLSVKTFEDDIKEVQDLGLHGVKFHPRIQLETFQQWESAGVFALLEEKNIPVIICGWLQSSVIPILDLTPLAIDRIAKKYPNLRIIIAHMGGHKYWDAFFTVRSNKHVYMNCSYFINFFKGTSLEQDFYNSLSKVDSKVIYGSDFPEIAMDTSLDYFKKKIAGLENVDQAAIFAKNLYKALGHYE